MRMYRLRAGPLAPGLVFVSLSLAASAQVCNSTPVATPDEADFFGGPVLVDVLANDTDADGEALEVLGLTTTCPGKLSEDFGVVTLTVSVPSLTSDCTISYQVQDERGGSAQGTVTVRDATGIFSDGFESGDLSSWSGAG